jgi:hypothetical protein
MVVCDLSFPSEKVRLCVLCCELLSSSIYFTNLLGTTQCYSLNKTIHSATNQYHTCKYNEEASCKEIAATTTPSRNFLLK